MTPKRAKKLTLEVWKYLALHGEIRIKQDLPKHLLKSIDKLRCKCPLCELYYHHSGTCPKCPLWNCVEGSAYKRWYTAGQNVTDPAIARQEAAREIVRIVEAWNPEESK